MAAAGLVHEQPLNGLPCDLCNLEPYRTTGLELSDDRSIANNMAGADVIDLQSNEV